MTSLANKQLPACRSGFCLPEDESVRLHGCSGLAVSCGAGATEEIGESKSRVPFRMIPCAKPPISRIPLSHREKRCDLHAPALLRRWWGHPVAACGSARRRRAPRVPSGGGCRVPSPPCVRRPGERSAPTHTSCRRPADDDIAERNDSGRPHLVARALKSPRLSQCGGTTCPSHYRGKQRCCGRVARGSAIPVG